MAVRVNRSMSRHEQVCAVMRDGVSRFALDICAEIDAPPGSIYPILAALEVQETLKSVRDPETGRRLYVWNHA